MTVNLSLFAGVGWQFFDNNGVILSGGKVYAYDAGTTTPRATYTSSSGAIPHANPIILDAAGRVPNGEIWLADTVRYKFVLKTSTDVTIATYDNVDSNGSGLQTNLANTSDATKGDALIGFRQSNSNGLLTGTVGRTVHQKFQESVSILDFGADPTGSTDSASAIQAALNSGARRIYAPSGTYKILSTLTIPKNVSLEGDGSEQSIFDGSSASYANLTDGRHIQTVEGTFTALPALSGNVIKGATTITFASAPSVQTNDVILIYNPTDYSYSGWRTYYRAGEYLRVASVSGNTVTLQGTLADSYAASAVDLYRYDDMTSFKMSGIQLIGLNDLSNPVFGLNLISCVDTVISSVKVTNCSYASIATSMCYNLDLDSCTATENFAASSSGGEYGLIIGNSQIVHVIGGYYASYRHGITIGGGSGIGKVPNRYVVINGAHITGANGAQVANFHGGTEYCSLTNCIIDGGFSGGGDYLLMSGNHIRANTGNGNVAMYMAEMRGLNVTISNNTIENPNASTGNTRGAFIDFGGNNVAIGTSTYKGGTINIFNNVLTWGITATTDCPTIKIVNRGYNASSPIGVAIKNNRMTMLNDNVYAGYADISVISATAAAWNAINVSENSFGRGGVLNVRNTTAGRAAANYLFCHNNVSDGTATSAIQVSGIQNLISIKGNTVVNSETYGIYAFGVSTSNRCNRVHIMNNTTYDNFVSTTNNSALNADIICWYAKYAVVQSNAGGSFNKILTVNSNNDFVIGETITGGTSGTTATIAFIRSTNDICIATTASGAFTVGETITGGTSGATTTVTAENFTTAYRNSYADIDNLWRGQNVGIRTSTDYVSNVTVNTSI